MSNDTPAGLEVTQADREAAAKFYEWFTVLSSSTEAALKTAQFIRGGGADGWNSVQAFARHRLATLPPARGEVELRGEAPEADRGIHVGKSWPRPATPSNLLPRWEGEFSSHADWVNFASKRLTVATDSNGCDLKAICVDAIGRRCANGRDFKRAEDEGTFPVRYFWDCWPAALAVSPSTRRVDAGEEAWQADHDREYLDEPESSPVEGLTSGEGQRDPALACLASLRAAISLLENGGKAAKKAAPSDRMFNQMLRDYRRSADNFAAVLSAAPQAAATASVRGDRPGWIVCNNVGQWRTFDSFGWAWTDRRDLAVRYARRSDAELVHGEDENSWRVELYPAASPATHAGSVREVEPLGEGNVELEAVVRFRSEFPPPYNNAKHIDFRYNEGTWAAINIADWLNDADDPDRHVYVRIISIDGKPVTDSRAAQEKGE